MIPARLDRFLVTAWVFVMLTTAPMPVMAQSVEDCQTCHDEKSLTTTRRGRVVSLHVDTKAFEASAHGSLGCVACHEDFSPMDIPHAAKIKPVDCSGCHNGENLARYQQSVHGKPKKTGKPAATCADCHTAHAIQRLTDRPVVERKELADAMCSRCHGDINAQYLASDHGKALARGVEGAPSCIDCHGEHEVQPALSEDARTSRMNEAKMCLGCHLDNEDVRARIGPSAGFIASYETSVHGLALKEGNEGAATCSDCHGSHQVKMGSDPTSKVAKTHIAETCGTCHGDVVQIFEESSHGKALARGVVASPTCTDCHGEHDILPPTDRLSRVSPLNVSAQVCSPCHSSLRLTEKYGLATDRFRSFADSYHGLAVRAGKVEVANCASCHGFHDIKPSSDPTSRTHKDNLAATCGSCHPGANENFARGSVHVLARSGDDEILYFVSTAYVILIIVTIGGMALHNIFDFLRKARRQLMIRRGIITRPHTAHRLYLRMSLNERIQHATLFISFAILVLTGFMLRYPDAWWVVWLRGLSPAVFDLRSLLHRIAGVVMVGAGVYHMYYVFFVPRGKQLLRDLLPVRRDIADMIGMVKYNLGVTPSKPKLDRFSYIEKAEYWALVWGTVVMGATGVILWFDNTFMGLLTKLGWDVARTIHFYEAWLATLAIIIWHFYFVIFNPDVYPMNVAWWKGTLTEEEMLDEHPLELERIKAREHSQRMLEEQQQRLHKMEGGDGRSLSTPSPQDDTKATTHKNKGG